MFSVKLLSNRHRHALQEVLKDPVVSAQLANTKAAEEVQALKDFFEMMHEEPERTVYGIRIA